MHRSLGLMLALLAACGAAEESGSQEGQGADAAAVPDAAPRGTDAAPPADVRGPWRRVLPGFDTEEACRAANPDPLIHCVERLSLCDDGRAYILFTDIVFVGAHEVQPTGALVTWEQYSTAFSSDGDTFFALGADDTLSSDEVYGDTPFVRATEPSADLCP